MASSASAIADGAPSLKDKPVAAPTPDWDIAFGGYVVLYRLATCRGVDFTKETWLLAHK
jgi:hypothetical protein